MNSRIALAAPVLVVIWALCAAPVGAQAHDARSSAAPLAVRVEAPSSPVTVGETFQLDVVLSLRGQGAVEELSLPQMPRGLTALEERRGSSTQISVVNGQRQVLMEQRFMFVIRADAPGRHVIPAALARAGSASAQSAPVTIRVVGDADADADTDAEDPSNQGQNGVPPSPGQRFGRNPPPAFVEVTLDRASAWVGQQITATTEVYTQQPLAQWPRLPALKPAGFFCASLLDENRPSPTQRSIAGRSYYVYLVNKDALFPLAPGDKTIGVQEVELLPAGSRFLRTQEVVARSAPVSVAVKALPEDNRPPGFSAGNVGRWQLEASVRPNLATLGEPVTLTLVATGTGSIEQLELPTWDGGGQARVFPATSKREPGPSSIHAPALGGRVMTELLVQPQREGQLRIPPLTLVTFDPDAGAYHSAVTPAFTIPVGPARRSGTAAAPTGGQQVIARGTRPLKRHVEVTTGNSEMPVLAGAAILGAGACIGAAGTLRRRRSASGAGRRRSLSRARQRALEDALARGDLAALQRLVLDALADRFGPDVKACATPELAGLLEGRGLAPADAAAVVRFIHDVEAARYARASASALERDALARAARALLERTDADARAAATRGDA